MPCFRTCVRQMNSSYDISHLSRILRNRMDRLGTMETFVRVVETGSFSAAARDLKIGQPAVSKSIAHLEERFGVRLVIPSTRGLASTEAGQDFYELARKIIAKAR